jgi:deoxyribose-phosphate aldolase
VSVPLTVEKLARMIDLSAVRAEVDATEVRRLAVAAKQYRCVCAFVLPCYLPELRDLLADAPDVGVGGAVGFPSGAHSTATKAAEARQQRAQGATELDMVINVGMLRSGRDRYVEDDIRAVVEAAEGIPVKVILEVHHLTDQEILRGSRLAVRAGAVFVKTATGWTPSGATLHNVRLIKQAVGDTAHVKAAGGVRDLQTVLDMIRLGVTRFGTGVASGVKILEECAAGATSPGSCVKVDHA